MNLEDLTLLVHVGGLAFVIGRTKARPDAYLMALAPITLLTVIQNTASHWAQMRTIDLVVVGLLVFLCLPFAFRWIKATRRPPLPFEALPTRNPIRQLPDDCLTPDDAQLLRSAGRGEYIISMDDLRGLLIQARVRRKKAIQADSDRVLGLVGHVMGLAAAIGLIVVSLMTR